MTILHQELSDRIIKLGIDVQKELGVGFLERVYENALVIALFDDGLKFERQKEYDVHFREKHVGKFVADLVIEDKIIVEIKAVASLTKAHYAQTINYLKASGLEIGYTINFGKVPLEFKRLANPNLTDR